jgi:DNA modification methylase
MPTLNWIGKDAVVNHHHKVPFHLLKVVPELSVGDPGSGNLIVQGDNLVALKALLPYYAGQVKCALIDPPYNTGSKTEQGWTYSDNVDHPVIKLWLNKVVGDEEEDLTRHDKWLCMMYPRLQLLKKFLTTDGVIFIHIGRDELGHLRMIADEIFDAKNLIEVLIWNTHGHTENQEEITGVHEYILLYARNKELAHIRNIVDPNVPADSKIRRDFAENSITKNGAKNPPSTVCLPAGFPCEIESLDLAEMPNFEDFHKTVSALGYISREITKQFNADYPVRQDRMIVKGSALQQPCRVFTGWSSADKLKEFIDSRCEPIDDEGTSLRFFLSKNGVIYYRREGRQKHYVESVLTNLGTTETNRYYLESMGIRFTYPKPLELTQYLLSLYTENTDIILDSFGGSGTTLEAALRLNQYDGQQRRFIGVEMAKENARDAMQKRLRCVVEGFTPVSGKYEGRNVPGIGGSFRFCELGEAVFDERGQIKPSVRFADLARHVYFTETGEPLPRERVSKSPLVGVCRGVGVYLLFNGILGDKSVDGGNVLTRTVLAKLPKHDGPKVIYAAGCRLGKDSLRAEQITFRQTPYEIKVS